MGRLADRFGIVVPITAGTVMLSVAYVASGASDTIWQFAVAYGLIGLGSSATFAPVMADISHWFTRRRGIAVAVASCGSYLAGTVWPPIVQYFIATAGWRYTHIGIGLFCAVTMLPLTFLALRPRAPVGETITTGRIAEEPSLMLGLGVISRLVCGLIADRIGGLKTLFLVSTLQAVTVLPYAMFNGLTSLYVMSAAYGLFQGGLIPMYAIVVREYFSPREAGARVGIVVGATLLGMALGGWMSGAIFDMTGSYRATFINAFVWNVFNLAIVLWLLLRDRRAGHRIAMA